MQIKRRVLRELTTKQSISHACANTGGTTVHCQCVLLLWPDGKSCIDLYCIFTLCTILLQNWRLLYTSRYSLRTAKNLILNVLFTHHFFGSAVGCVSCVWFWYLDQCNETINKSVLLLCSTLGPVLITIAGFDYHYSVSEVRLVLHHYNHSSSWMWQSVTICKTLQYC